MPLKSKAMMRKMFSLEKEGKLKKGTTERFIKETPNMSKLPDHLKNANKK